MKTSGLEKVIRQIMRTGTPKNIKTLDIENFTQFYLYVNFSLCKTQNPVICALVKFYGGIPIDVDTFSLAKQILIQHANISGYIILKVTHA